MASWTRLCGAGAVMAVLAASGCASTVAGTAVRDPNAPPPKTTLEESDLDGVLLSTAALDGILHTSGLKVIVNTDIMQDQSDSVVDSNCLGAAYGVQQPVYAKSGWTAVRDQVVREPVEQNKHWLEQAVVLYPSAAAAKQFLGKSRSDWAKCAGTLVTFGDGNQVEEWNVTDVTENGSTISQTSTPDSSNAGGCHHAMAVGANVIVETWACGDSVTDEAVTIANDIVANIKQL
jgi:hypothetical protein